MTTKLSCSWKWIAVSVFLLALLISLIYSWDIDRFLIRVLDYTSGLGLWGPFFFLLFYILAAICLLPAFILSLGAGLLFGTVLGSVLVSLSSTVAATLAFLIGRYVAQEWIHQKIRGNQLFESIDRSVAKEGWKIVGLCRLFPVIPYNLLNYAFGITQVNLKTYFFASWIGMMPGTVMYVYIGSVARDLATLRVSNHPLTSIEWALYLIGLVAIIALVSHVSRLARETLRKKKRG